MAFFHKALSILLCQRCGKNRQRFLMNKNVSGIIRRLAATSSSSISSESFQTTKPYIPHHKPIRILTATSIFDGHDAAINIMRRIMQQSPGVEVIHLGHDRSVNEVVNAAIQEDVNAIAVSCYQGGHMEYFKYMYDLLQIEQQPFPSSSATFNNSKQINNNIKIFGGGGGVILPNEINELMEYGITRIYSPNDGRNMGLQGMINDLLHQSDFPIGKEISKCDDILSKLSTNNPRHIARLISSAKNFPSIAKPALDKIQQQLQIGATKATAPVVIGLTGPGGSGKSSVLDEFVRRFLIDFPNKTVGIVSIDPTKRRTGGALLGDRIRMNSINTPNVYMRSLAASSTADVSQANASHIVDIIDILKIAGYDMIMIETPGIGQGDGTEITEMCDLSIYVMTPEYGAAMQLEKISMLDYADIIAINKCDKIGSLDAIRDVKKQYQRNYQLFDMTVDYNDSDNLPVYGTIASNFNDFGMIRLYKGIMEMVVKKSNNIHLTLSSTSETKINNQSEDERQQRSSVILPPSRSRYLLEIVENIRRYDTTVDQQAKIAEKLYGIFITLTSITGVDPNKVQDKWLIKSGLNEGLICSTVSDEENTRTIKELLKEFNRLKQNLDESNWGVIINWEQNLERYREPVYNFEVRGKSIDIETQTETLSHSTIPKVSMPRYKSWGTILRWSLEENVPGEFPYTAGVYPFKRTGEDPTRMFAGEGSPERTNRRFHYVSKDMPTKRLSTAFDSVTLYGRDPTEQKDVYGKVGNAGVSICCLDDAKKLYSGFDLTCPTTSVSMTINGPAPTMLAFFMNAAIDQNVEKYIYENRLEGEVTKKIEAIYETKGGQRPQYVGDLPEGHNGLGLMLLGVTGDMVLPVDTYNEIKDKTLREIRGTIQADILKEDQAQNTCIFSTPFALRLMGDIEEYFIQNNIRNFYSISVSGYHIGDAGANPITELAFTLANGFTYVEYYLSRGMDIDHFGPNLSFFFSSGLDAEYAVMGRVARRIWAKAMKMKYGANPRTQKLKYHIQTSGRSLHAQEIDFNDIRTTLEALMAIYDNANSLHTNAYDEAITTPTEESVRRAIAIQLIINKEFGLARNSENPTQGSFLIEQLTDLVEEAVMREFESLDERGGVLGAMEAMYQRNKIQEESLYYESRKNTGNLPIIGVNTYLGSNNNEKDSSVVGEGAQIKVSRSTDEEKDEQINTASNLYQTCEKEATESIEQVKHAVSDGKNVFGHLMEATKVCSLGQITKALFEVGGQYRRNM